MYLRRASKACYRTLKYASTEYLWCRNCWTVGSDRWPRKVPNAPRRGPLRTPGPRPAVTSRRGGLTLEVAGSSPSRRAFSASFRGRRGASVGSMPQNRAAGCGGWGRLVVVVACGGGVCGPARAGSAREGPVETGCGPRPAGSARAGLLLSEHPLVLFSVSHDPHGPRTAPPAP